MERFRGGFPATMDVKGRLKLPTRLREQLEGSFGRELFVCAFTSHEIEVWPLASWQEFEAQLALQPRFKPAVRKLIERINYGQQLDLDDHGRLLIPALLREMVEVSGEVVVSGRLSHLAVTNRDRAATVLSGSALSDDELEQLAELELR